MDTFFTILKKSLVATVFVIFAFAATYVPHNYNKIEPAQAVWSTLPGQMVALVEQAATAISTYASAAYDAITSWATDSLWTKEYVLDGIAWAVAKAIISSMVQTLVDWINSGFQGSPAFLQNLKNHLLQAADERIGQYISDLGALGSFICSPFRLDVQIAVALQYDQLRFEKGDGQPAPTCTLTGVIDNIEGFITGDFTDGGWDDWFDITATPQTYTPYGSVLAAQAGARVRILNAQNEEVKILDFGSGFLSGELCNIVQGGSGASRQECAINKPGKIIEEALSFNLDSGRQSLITADEIDEVIAALLSQLANAAITGAAGLLGLSGGTGQTYSGYAGGSYVNAVQTQQAGQVNTGNSRELMTNALATQQRYFALAEAYEVPLLAAINSTTTDALKLPAIQESYNETQVVKTNTTSYIASLNDIIARYDAAVAAGDTAAQATIVSQFTSLRVYSETQLTNSQNKWQRTLS